MFPKKPTEELECDLSFKKFENHEEISKHKQNQHCPDSFYEKLVEDISVSCSVCKKYFCMVEIEDHMKSEHNPNEKSGLVRVRVNTYQRVPNPKPKLKSGTPNNCDQCAYMAISLRSLELHKNKVHAALHSCDECDKKFSEKDSLKHHKLNIHAVEFKCSECEFVARNLKFLNLHKATKHTSIPLVKGMGMKGMLV